MRAIKYVWKEVNTMVWKAAKIFVFLFGAGKLHAFLLRMHNCDGILSECFSLEDPLAKLILNLAISLTTIWSVGVTSFYLLKAK